MKRNLLAVIIISVIGAALIISLSLIFILPSEEGNFRKIVLSNNFQEAGHVFGVDVDGDNDIDVIGAAEEDNEIAWWENDGNESFTQHTVTNSFAGAGAVHAADLDNDGSMEILGAAWYANSIAHWGSASGVITNTFNYAHSVFAIDVDGDSDKDVLGSALQIDEIAWWESDFVGVDEGGNASVNHFDFGPTVINGHLRLPSGKQCYVYDIAGRTVSPVNLKPGIYFVKIEEDLRKVVKAR